MNAQRPKDDYYRFQLARAQTVARRQDVAITLAWQGRTDGVWQWRRMDDFRQLPPMLA